MSDYDGKRVEPYPEAPMTRDRLETETYEYHMPFNYPNITVERRYLKGQEWHGVEINPVNSIGADEQHLPPDTITVVEDMPIVRVVVMGSACVPPGYIQLEAEPLDEFYKPVDVRETAAVRYRINNLWGMHMRCDSWLAESEGDILDERGRRYTEIPRERVEQVWGRKESKYRMKAHYRENPLVGMSCGVFEIPKSRKIVITGGSEICAWSNDNYPDDVHYSFRTIRVTLVKNG